MSLVMMPPLVSMPRDSRVTSSSRTSLTSPLSTPACSEAPTATTSSGFTPLCGSLPVNSRTSSVTAGIHQERGHRAIGVVYRPQFERAGNYVPTVLARRYDAVCYLDRTHALTPLHP